MNSIAIKLTINIFDLEALYEQALKAYMRDDETRRADAIGWLGEPSNPDIGNCLTEIWSEYTPADAGYEFIDWTAVTDWIKPSAT